MNAATDTLTVLVAGHRPERLPTGTAGEMLLTRLADLLCRLQQQAQPTGLRLLTGVAAGIDQFVAQHAAGQQLPLHLLAPGEPEPLDMHQKRAERIVWMGVSKQDDNSESLQESLALRDQTAIAFADVVVVVWDGQAPQGLKSGTVRTAFLAACAMKPVLWLSTDGSLRCLDRSRLDGPQLRRLRGLTPQPEWLYDSFGAPLDDSELHGSIAALLQLLQTPWQCMPDDQEAAKIPAYLDMTARDLRPSGRFHSSMMALIGGDIQRARSIWRRQTAWTEADIHRPVLAPVLLNSYFQRFDQVASYNAGLHRDATWLIYMGSTAAVFAAVSGSIGLWPGGHNMFWSVFEFVVVALVIGGVAVAKRGDWHKQWIAHRFMAEQIRHTRMCLSLLSLPHPFLEPAWAVEQQGTQARLIMQSSELWILQRLLAAQGLPVTHNGEPYLPSDETIRQQIVDEVQSTVRSQCDYHHNSAARMEQVSHRLHMFSMGLFWATAVAVLAHFFTHASVILLFTAFFPAWGAAIHGLSTKLEIARIAAQSEHTARQLSELEQAIALTRECPGTVGWNALRQLVVDSAAVMSDENGQWHQLISHQETDLPA